MFINVCSKCDHYSSQGTIVVLLICLLHLPIISAANMMRIIFHGLWFKIGSVAASTTDTISSLNILIRKRNRLECAIAGVDSASHSTSRLLGRQVGFCSLSGVQLRTRRWSRSKLVKNSIGLIRFVAKDR
jgi:hypothetical protein